MVECLRGLVKSVESLIENIHIPENMTLPVVRQNIDKWFFCTHPLSKSVSEPKRKSTFLQTRTSFSHYRLTRARVVMEKVFLNID